MPEQIRGFLPLTVQADFTIQSGIELQIRLGLIDSSTQLLPFGHQMQQELGQLSDLITILGGRGIHGGLILRLGHNLVPQIGVLHLSGSWHSLLVSFDLDFMIPVQTGKVIKLLV